MPNLRRSLLIADQMAGGSVRLDLLHNCTNDTCTGWAIDLISAQMGKTDELLTCFKFRISPLPFSVPGDILQCFERISTEFAADEIEWQFAMCDDRRRLDYLPDDRFMDWPALIRHPPPS